MQKYVMLTQDNCKYCTAALGLLKAEGHTVDVYDVTKHENRALRKTNTVPQIFDSEKNFIGGYTELKEHLNG